MTWPLVPLGEVAQINPRLTASLADSDVVSFLGMADVSEAGTTIGGTDRQYLTVKKGFTPFARGDLLVGKITPCFENGKIAQAATEHEIGFGSTEFHVVRVDELRADSRYILHLLRSPKIRLDGERRMTGSAGQKRVPRAFLEEIAVPLPPLPEQRRIASILDQADLLRTQSRRSLSLLNELEEEVFFDEFGDVVRNTRGWAMGQVSDLVSGFKSGKSLASVNEGEGASIRILKVSAVTRGIFDPAESKPLPSTYAPPAEHFVQQGDLLFSRANTSELIGATAIVRGTHPNLVLPDKLWRFMWAPGAQNSTAFIRCLFWRPEFRRLISERAAGSSGSMKNISQPAVLSLPLVMPPVAVREQFGRSYSQIEIARQTAAAQLLKMDEFFASLQHRAFEGTL